MREWFSYRIMDRTNEADTILWSSKLFHQFLFDGWTMIESEMLHFIRRNQNVLRTDKYVNLQGFVSVSDRSLNIASRRIILPSIFFGSPQFMTKIYHDAMGICKIYGFPNVFITFTCNSKWKEITRFVKSRGLRPVDRQDILEWVFKMKLDSLVRDLKKENIFGRVITCSY